MTWRGFGIFILSKALKLPTRIYGAATGPEEGVGARPVLHIFKACGFKNMLVPLPVRASGSLKAKEMGSLVKYSPDLS